MSEPEPQYYSLQVHGRLLGDRPVCCLHLTPHGDTEPMHTLLLTLDQADGLQLDLERSKIEAMNGYIRRRSAFNELEADLRAWETLKPPEEETPND